MYHITSGERVMGDIDSAGELLELVSADERISVSTLCPFEGSEISDTSFAAVLADKSGGIVFAGYDVVEDVKPMAFRAAINPSFIGPVKPDFLKPAKENIKKALDDKKENEYSVISSTTLKTIKLDKKLYNKSTADTDKDGIVDWDEVNIEFIRETLKTRGKSLSSEIKTEDLPTLSECIGYYQKNHYYLDSTINKLFNPSLLELNYYILPILSDPVDADGDNDGTPDYCDINKLFPHNSSIDLDTNIGTKGEDTFEIIITFDTFEYATKKIGERIDVYYLPALSSINPKYVFSEKTSDRIRIYGVVKSEDGYWLKVKAGKNGVLGYIRYSTDSLIFDSVSFDETVEKYKMYHINLLSYKEFDIHPEYQGFLMALADEYKNLNEYIDAGYPFNGFIFMGICAGESSATSDNKSIKNLEENGFFGSTSSVGKYQTDGDKAAISALRKCYLAFSDAEAKGLMDENAKLYPGVYAFYSNAAKFIGHLELRLRDTEKLTAPWYEPTNNHTSYLPAVANAIRWESAYKSGKEKGDKDYKYWDSGDYSNERLKDTVGIELFNKCQYIKDGTLNPKWTGYGNPSYSWWWK